MQQEASVILTQLRSVYACMQGAVSLATSGSPFANRIAIHLWMYVGTSTTVSEGYVVNIGGPAVSMSACSGLHTHSVAVHATRVFDSALGPCRIASITAGLT